MLENMVGENREFLQGPAPEQFMAATRLLADCTVVASVAQTYASTKACDQRGLTGRR